MRRQVENDTAPLQYGGCHLRMMLRIGGAWAFMARIARHLTAHWGVRGAHRKRSALAMALGGAAGESSSLVSGRARVANVMRPDAKTS